MSFSSRMRESAEPVAISTCFFWSGRSGEDSSTCSMPMMPFMGVRISWLIIARKSLFARLAASARSLASLRVLTSARFSKMSRHMRRRSA